MTKEIYVIKSLLKKSIKDNNVEKYNYIHKLLIDHVRGINKLYTHVCFIIKLFLLDCEANHADKNIIYHFDESFINYCFRLARNNKIQSDDSIMENDTIIDVNEDQNNDMSNENLNEEQNDNIINDQNNTSKDLKELFSIFYAKFNSDTTNARFVLPENLKSITHITNALAREINTNIKNNIILHFTKHAKEYVNVEIKNEFSNDSIANKTKLQIIDDLLYGTLYSDQKFHQFITQHREKIIPKIDNHNLLTTMKDGLNNKQLPIFISKYVKENIILESKMNNEKIETTTKNYKTITNHILNGNKHENKSIDNWINENSNVILKEFNDKKCINFYNELDKNPYIFIKHMLCIDKRLEGSSSRKKYQVIPIRTNFTPKFIPINVHSFVDMLDSKYLLKNIKNYYHNQTDRGIILFETYFNFSSKYIKNSIKKGYIFSGLIQTNGYEIIYHFHSKEYARKKANFHECGNNERKLLKEINNSDKTESEKADLLNKHKKAKKAVKEASKKVENEIKAQKKKADKEKLDKIDEETHDEAEKMKTEFDKSVDELTKKHEEDIMKIKNESQKNSIDELKKNCDEDYKSDLAYLLHCYNRNLQTLKTDHNNNINEKFKNIEDKILANDKDISNVREEIKNLKQLKKSLNVSGNITSKDIPQTNIPKKIDKNVLNQILRIMNKITKSIDSMKHEPEDINLTKKHMLQTKATIIKYFIKIKNIDKLNELKNFRDYFAKYVIDTDEIMPLISPTKLSNIMMKLVVDVQKLKSNVKPKIKKINNEPYRTTRLIDVLYNEEMKVLNNTLNDLFIEKKQLEGEMFNLFKTNGGEFMKVDNMSKKYFEILDKLNWAVIDPGMNSIFTMMSKDRKTRYNYTKGLHINRTSRKRYLLRVEKYKKAGITKIEDEMSENTTVRWKTSTKYENFIKYYNNKMKNYDNLTNLYDNEKLNKLKWNQFVNDKRSEDLLVNDIKRKFGSNVVLILGDWSMCKGHIKGHAPTPNKKYTDVLERNFITLRINEFRTSIIHNKHELVCKNYVKSYDPQKENIKYVKTMEILRNKNEKKYNKLIKGKSIHKILVCKTNEKTSEYVNRDENSTKNMIKIVESYIKTNHKPIQCVMCTKVRIKRDSL